jgi:hypothetical protein
VQAIIWARATLGTTAKLIAFAPRLLSLPAPPTLTVLFQEMPTDVRLLATSIISRRVSPPIRVLVRCSSPIWQANQPTSSSAQLFAEMKRNFRDEEAHTAATTIDWAAVMEIEAYGSPDDIDALFAPLGALRL